MSLQGSSNAGWATVPLSNATGDQFYVYRIRQGYNTLVFDHLAAARRFVAGLVIPPAAQARLLDLADSSPPRGMQHNHGPAITWQDGVNPGQFRRDIAADARSEVSHSRVGSFALRETPISMAVMPGQVAERLAQALYHQSVYVSHSSDVQLRQALQKAAIASEPSHTVGFSGHSEKPQKAKTFHSIADANDWIISQQLPDTYWQTLLTASNTAVGRHSGATSAVAELLVAGKVWVSDKPKVVVQSQYAPGSPSAASALARQAPAAVPAAAPVSSEEMISANDVQHQVETLVDAAVSGAAFCEECGKRPALLREDHKGPEIDRKHTSENNFKTSLHPGSAVEDNKLTLGTKIDSQVVLVERDKLESWTVETFKDGHVETVETIVPVVLFRKFGGGVNQAKLVGAYASTTMNAGRNETAVYPAWSSSRFEAELVIPSNQKLNVGKVGQQPPGASKPRYRGGSDQILLPRNWPTSWVKSVRDGKTQIVYTLEEFEKKFPDQVRRG
ncbi:Uncharacterised protein [BD1-7 clade bacterium]|uniref:Uncharacterized protein n=1 Tax=BD1-7 clade bacterium TaxID=2029982 RepID=A0A5S9PGN3_9GAMM|nr:Uncharacterised protein [BD1-7 clade bacterium]CAA0102884.1 Uncharacterised protein [BD1-7 clade bacterium]